MTSTRSFPPGLTVVSRSASILPALVVACALGVAPGAARPAWAQDAPFVRGDLDQSGSIDVTDPVLLLRHLFLGDPRAGSCQDAADIDDDGLVGMTDAIYALDWLFRQGPRIAAPGPFCHPDPTADDLGCAEYGACAPTAEVYGLPLTGDTIVFVIDRSGSMQGSGELARAVEEVSGALRGLREGDRFAIVVFDSGVNVFPAGATETLLATPETVEAASAWLRGLGGGAGSCFARAMLTALALALSGAGEGEAVGRSVLVYVGDGGGTCQGASEREYLERSVDLITAENELRCQIHAIGVLMGFGGRRLQEGVLRDLVARNGGVYVPNN